MKTVKFYNHDRLGIDKIQRIPDDEAAIAIKDGRGIYVPKYKWREYRRISDKRLVASTKS